MGLVDKQNEFTGMVVLLIRYAHSKGYQVTLGDAFRSEQVLYGHPNSLHRKRLAIDLNLFKGGKYLTTTDDHREMGEYWEEIGGSWGGRFNDANHYSLEHEGMK